MNISLWHLGENETLSLPAAQLSMADGLRLWREFDQKGGWLRVAFPTPATGDCWRLTPLGWVGTLPVRPDLQLHIAPKVPLRHLFGMWEYAYGFRQVAWLAGMTAVSSVAEFYQCLAQVLAGQVIQRGQRGFYHTYLSRSEHDIYIKGQLIQPFPPPTGKAALLCRFAEFTADVPDNQILAYTLGQVLAAGWCVGADGAVATAVTQAYRLLLGVARPRPFAPEACVGRVYSRLNQDYQPLHALCRFFLAHRGPVLALGEEWIRPFLVDMPRLYEQFVAAWLAQHLPPPWQVRPQESVQIGAAGELAFEIDLVLYDGAGRPQAVLDTKYKTPTKADNVDVNQVVTYAAAKGCAEAILLYPVALARPLDVNLHGIRVRSLTFSLADDLELAGQSFLATLLPQVGVTG